MSHYLHRGPSRVEYLKATFSMVASSVFYFVAAAIVLVVALCLKLDIEFTYRPIWALFGVIVAIASLGQLCWIVPSTIYALRNEFKNQVICDMESRIDTAQVMLPWRLPREVWDGLADDAQRLRRSWKRRQERRRSAGK